MDPMMNGMPMPQGMPPGAPPMGGGGPGVCPCCGRPMDMQGGMPPDMAGPPMGGAASPDMDMVMQALMGSGQGAPPPY